MKKTRELIANYIKQVDAVIELRDARIPISSQNPEIENLVKDKKRIIILTKADLADPKGNVKWIEYFKKQNIEVLIMDIRNNKQLKELYSALEKGFEEKAKKLEKKGIGSFRRRLMILGIPNVGKSTLINSMAKRKSAEVGNRPGVTKSKQWIKLSREMELLDTPGILWPKFEDKEVAKHLAYTGAIKDEVIDLETLAYNLIEEMQNNNMGYLLEKRYDIQLQEQIIDTMDVIGKKRGFLIRGGEIDYSRLSRSIMDDFRSGKMGRITLEFPK